jgi:phytoene dehydrogenase-like protein
MNWVRRKVLARGGWNVLVLDRSTAHADGATDVAGWVAPAIVTDLDLRETRTQDSAPDPWVSAPVADGARLELWNDVTRSAESIRRFSPNDAARWPAFCDQMSTLARALETLSMAPPPDPMGEGIGALADLGGLALRMRRHGQAGTRGSAADGADASRGSAR